MCMSSSHKRALLKKLRNVQQCTYARKAGTDEEHKIMRPSKWDMEQAQRRATRERMEQDTPDKREEQTEERVKPEWEVLADLYSGGSSR